MLPAWRPLPNLGVPPRGATLCSTSVAGQSLADSHVLSAMPMLRSPELPVPGLQILSAYVMLLHAEDAEDMVIGEQLMRASVVAGGRRGSSTRMPVTTALTTIRPCTPTATR